MEPTGEYQGPWRRHTDPHRNGGLQVNTRLASVSVSGQYTIAIIALLLVALSGFVVLRFWVQAAQAQIEAIQALTSAVLQTKAVATAEHERLIAAIDKLSEEESQTRCLLTLASEASRREAMRSRDPCSWIGIPSRAHPTGR